MKAAFRNSGAPVQSNSAIVASAPIQSDAADRCSQSAISVFHDDPGSTASWPETESPPANTTASANAGTSGSTRSSSHET